MTTPDSGAGAAPPGKPSAPDAPPQQRSQLKPSIAVRALMVFKDGRCLLETRFHKGLNIVSGHNSSGKTTTLDFIAHTMGVEDIPWKKEALLCDYSMVELLLNDVPVTLRRDVSESPMKPLHLFWGDLEKSLAAPFSEWQVYPFRRSPSKLSFTQTLLLALDMPEAQGDGASNLTMHQFLRVMYADQPSLHSPIFRIDSFDNALTRATVGDYLAGVYDDRLYSAQLAKRELERSLSSAESELRSIFAVLAKSQQDFNLQMFSQQIVEAESRRDALMKELLRLRGAKTVERDRKRNNDEAVTRTALDSAKRQLNGTIDRLARLDAELEDSKQFIAEIESRLRSLDQSQATRGYLGAMAFNFCPCCLNPVETPAVDGNACSLCKAPLGAPSGETQVLRMRNELRIQLRESHALLADRVEAAAKLRLSIPAMRQELRRLELRYVEATENWSSELESAIEKILREAGALDQEIKTLHENQRLAEVIRGLQAKRDDLHQQIVALNSTIESLVYAQEQRKQKVALTVSQTASRLLKQDLYRQAEFKTAEVVRFSFEENSVSVDGSTKFSESSTVVLRHLFHVALLTASIKMPEMRLPRFLMLDGIEDGGMELPRAHRLQEIIAAECETYDADFQLIMATSQIAPSLNNEAYVVGRRYTEEERALQFQ